jgi:hypothetical protein
MGMNLRGVAAGKAYYNLSRIHTDLVTQIDKASIASYEIIFQIV